jgi:hypothetical protein
MDKKTTLRLGIILVFAVAASLTLSGCGKKTTEQKSEAPAASKKSAAFDCSAGFSKMVMNMKYQRTGKESQTIQGRTFNLCCWNKLSDQGQPEKKICGDQIESPLGYKTGILWEIEKETGNAVKTMETYQKDGKSCQQDYNKDGSLGSESCG